MSQEMRTTLNTSNYRPEQKEQTHIGTEQKMLCGSHSTGSTKTQANRPEGFLEYMYKASIYNKSNWECKYCTT